MNFKNTARCATLILLSAISGTALATVSVDSPAAVPVRFADLDLNSPADLTTLYKRIKRATYRVCVVPRAGQELRAARLAEECRTSSMDRAVQQLSLPALTEMHRKKTGSTGQIWTAGNH